MHQVQERDARPGGEMGDRVMRKRIQNIMLAASNYDAFVLEEGGQLSELVDEEYRNLGLSVRYLPKFDRPASCRQALKQLRDPDYEVDLVVATPRLPDMDVRDFLVEVRQARPHVAASAIAAHAWDIPKLDRLCQENLIDSLFLWQGEVSVLLAMIKLMEDKLNADHDVMQEGVQVVVVVEDEVRFYSAYLPMIYAEITRQTRKLLSEGLNMPDRLRKLQLRPKIMLARNYEAAWELITKFRDNLLGVITDVGMPKGGEYDPEAGISLAAAVKAAHKDVPVLVQSSDERFREKAAQVGASFVNKGSPDLLAELSRFIQHNFGFGEFVFKVPLDKEGKRTKVVAKAKDIREMLAVLPEVPASSLLYHGARNHFSIWLRARTEFELARELRPLKLDDFKGAAKLRSFLINRLSEYLREVQRHAVVEFDEEKFDQFVAFAKIGSGSLGGKGRGLAFFHNLLAHTDVELGSEMEIPQTVVLASQVFDEFLRENDLEGLLTELDELTDEEILDRFRAGRFNHQRRAQLARVLQVMKGPIAVRSSSILEDSLYQPFAGIYATVMLANNHPSLDVRLAQLLEAIKRVYASTYSKMARNYLRDTPHRIEEEKMAVLVQRLAGKRRGKLFYPLLSGVACSYNFYPFGKLSSSDGVAQIALGLGKAVVEDYEAIRFCPRYPTVLPQFGTSKDTQRNAQKTFFALDLDLGDVIPGNDPEFSIRRLGVHKALDFLPREAGWVASTYFAADDMIRSGYEKGGVPLVTFLPLLKSHHIPFASDLANLLDVAQEAIGNPVEIEFAYELYPEDGEGPKLYVLQLRPLVAGPVGGEVRISAEMERTAIVFSPQALGHGFLPEMRDIVVVDPLVLPRSKTKDAASAVAQINEELARDGRHYVLIGPGRWGSRDPWLGIPVVWGQINMAKVIVEAEFPDLDIEPSQGSHFFHNLTSLGIPYLTVNTRRGFGRLDWGWLRSQPRHCEALDGGVYHVRLKDPLVVAVDGTEGKAVVLPSLGRGNLQS